MKHHGFTLLELAIVMAIIGLIAGGVVVGANMIEAAENRSLISDVEKYRTVVHTFKEKYGKFPGDLHNATRFWEKIILFVLLIPVPQQQMVPAMVMAMAAWLVATLNILRTGISGSILANQN